MANLLIQPAPVPSVSKSMQNALAMKSMQIQNELGQKQLQDYPEDREWTKHLREFRTSLEPLAKVEALDKMLRLLAKKMTLSNHDQVTENAYNQLGMDQNMTQNRVSAAQITEEARAAGQDPETYYQNVYKPKSLMTWEQQFELIKEDLKVDKPTYEHHTIYNIKDPTKTKRISYKKGEDYTPPEGWALPGAEKPTPRRIGETRTIQKGENVITEEWDGKKWTEIGEGPKFKKTTGKDKAEQKKLTDIASDYQQAIGRYYSLMSGVGIMSEALGKQNQKMAEEAKTQADNLAKQYKDLGGDVADLGVMEVENKSLRDRAIELLKANNKVINEETIVKVMDRLEGP